MSKYIVTIEERKRVKVEADSSSEAIDKVMGQDEQRLVDAIGEITWTDAEEVDSKKFCKCGNLLAPEMNVCVECL